MVDVWSPDGLPVLSRGKHRTARKGACFMEMASVLANEPWSDHPSCTHPLLAGLARLVNDNTSDERRGELAVLIPSVVGVRGGGLEWTVSVTAAVALQAIPDVPEHSQRALAAGLIRCQELGEDAAIARALEQVPAAVAWARRFTAGSTIKPKQFEKRTAPTVMKCAVLGLLNSTAPDPDAKLRELLKAGIAAAQPRPVRSSGPRAVSPLHDPSPASTRG